MNVLKILFACRYLLFFPVIQVLTGLALVAIAQQAHGTNERMDDKGRIMHEAMELIRTHALLLPGSMQGVTTEDLRTYVHSLDDYSDYLSAREYAAFLESNISDYFGVQMDIQKKKGVITLFPFRGGAAEKSGIRPGDELMAVDGSPVYGKSVFVVGSQIRGAEGGAVQLTIRSGGRIPRTLTLRRQRAHYESVSLRIATSAYYIQITRFIEGTDNLLSGFVTEMRDASKTIVIDLRGNQGGSLYAARQCADLFLEKGVLLYTLRYRDRVEQVYAEQPQATGASILLIQDENTASAAEVFIAALTRNGRARSAGHKTYGKGMAQRFFSLSNGSALLLTYAEIITPDNFSYHGIGIEPDITLPEDLATMDFNQDAALSKLFDFVNLKHK
jgi:carboxyl-terminal processing protease